MLAYIKLRMLLIKVASQSLRAKAMTLAMNRTTMTIRG
jgi:hypothetical protein